MSVVLVIWRAYYRQYLGNVACAESRTSVQAYLEQAALTQKIIKQLGR
jgi:hypothetical protein